MSCIKSNLRYNQRRLRIPNDSSYLMETVTIIMEELGADPSIPDKFGDRVLDISYTLESKREETKLSNKLVSLGAKSPTLFLK